MAIPKRKLRKETTRKLGALESTLKACERERARFEKYNLHEIAGLISASQFCLICEADITVLLCEMMCAKDAWSRVLFARFLALILIEGAEDLPQVLGRQFRDALTKTVADQRYLQRLNSLAKILSEFKRKHEKSLREIRNIAAAHRDLEARKQIQIIEKVDTKQIKVLTIEFQNALLEFVKLMTEIINEFTFPNMIKGKVNFRLIAQRISQSSEYQKLLQSNQMR